MHEAVTPVQVAMPTDAAAASAPRASAPAVPVGLPLATRVDLSRLDVHGLVAHERSRPTELSTDRLYGEWRDVCMPSAVQHPKCLGQAVIQQRSTAASAVEPGPAKTLTGRVTS
jgi:hypothetical protein